MKANCNCDYYDDFDFLSNEQIQEQCPEEYRMGLETWYNRCIRSQKEDIARQYYRMLGASGTCDCVVIHKQEFLEACRVLRDKSGGMLPFYDASQMAAGMLQTAVAMAESKCVPLPSAVAAHPFIDREIIDLAYHPSTEEKW